jgi:hypothetical protein
MPRAPLLRTLAAWTAVAALLTGVFMLYTQPQLMVTLSEQLWACFN